MRAIVPPSKVIRQHRRTRLGPLSPRPLGRGPGPRAPDRARGRPPSWGQKRS